MKFSTILFFTVFANVGVYCQSKCDVENFYSPVDVSYDDVLVVTKFGDRKS